MAYVSYTRNVPPPPKPNRKKWCLIFGIVVVILGIGAGIFVKNNTSTKTAVPEPPVAEQTDVDPQEDAVPAAFNLQPVVDEWMSDINGTASVVIEDLDRQETAAIYNPDQPYFAASIYKLYVAFEGYRAVDDGSANSGELYFGEWNRARCLDEMIRSSHSPCGEKMWSELGKSRLTEQLKTYGLKNTSMTALSTTAADASIVLRKLHQREGIAESSANAYLDSMKKQDAKFRRGLPSGFSKATVYNKVGWNELNEWHDTAIVAFSNGRTFSISVFTEGVGMNQVAKLGGLIEAAVATADDQGL